VVGFGGAGRTLSVAIACAGFAAGEPAARDLATLVAAEQALGAADRAAGTPESRWAWLEALARVAWASAEAGDHRAAAERYRAAIGALPDDAEAMQAEFVAMLHDGLGRALQNEGRFDEAAIHLGTGLRIRAAQDGGTTQRGISEGHLGLLELVRGRYAEAERLFRDALRHTPDERHDLLAHRHDCLGRYHLTLRAHGLAAEHFESAIRHAARVVKPDDPLLADLRANLVLCRFRGGDPEAALAEAESLLAGIPEREAGALRRAGLLNLCATIHAALKDAGKAERRIAEALEIVTAAKGADHPAVAPMLANLGSIRLQAGDAKGALEPLRRARALLGKDLAEHHQAQVELLYQIAACQLAAGSPAEARQAVGEARAAAGGLLATLVAGGSERELLTFRQQVDPHSIVCRLGDPEMIADSLLDGKGRILEAVLDRRARSSWKERRAGELQAEADRLLLEDGLAARDRLVAIRGEIQRLGAADGESALAGDPPRWQAVAAALPAGSVWVDCARYHGEPGGEPRYGAVLVKKEGAPLWIPLGEERLLGRLDLLHRSLETRANLLRHGEGAAGIPMLPLLTDLYRAFWQPVAAALPAGTREVILCPEGGLHLLPFAVLRRPDGGFLCEELPALRVVDSGRRLMPPGPAAVDFSKPWLALGVADFAPQRKLLDAGEPPWPPAWAEALAGIDDLPTVRAELADLRQLAPAGSAFLLDRQARESALRGGGSPAVLHFASHGFHVPLAGGGDLAADPSALYENGILLAVSDGDDGILFPEEAGALDLRDTGLVTLSTCRGALGRPLSGEGLLGLRRGFAKAGARHVMASLWEIPDRSTAEFMASYYAALRRGKSPSELLWSLQAERLGALRGAAPAGDAMETAILSYGGFVITSP
jgi:tetratricopeptide (TPR) repeat protein